jgi:Flp pilus assembly protein TadG
MSRRGRRDRGSATVELTLAAPLAGFLLMLVVQFAMWAHATHIAQAAANAGVQAARVHGGSVASGEDTTHAVLDQLAGSTLSEAGVTVDRTATDATVTIDGTAAAVLPGLSLPVHTSVTAPREQIPGVP